MDAYMCVMVLVNISSVQREYAQENETPVTETIVDATVAALPTIASIFKLIELVYGCTYTTPKIVCENYCLAKMSPSPHVRAQRN